LSDRKNLATPLAQGEGFYTGAYHHIAPPRKMCQKVCALSAQIRSKKEKEPILWESRTRNRILGKGGTGKLLVKGKAVLLTTWEKENSH